MDLDSVSMEELEAMGGEEISEEQQKLLDSIDPNIIASYLSSMGWDVKQAEMAEMEPDMEPGMEDDTEDVGDMEGLL